MFWDSSALLVLLVDQPGTKEVRRLPAAGRVVWWGTQIECLSAIQRLRREGRITEKDVFHLEEDLGRLLSQSIEIQPREAVRARAGRLLRIHPLRAADAFQLASALAFYEDDPAGERFACLDQRLAQAARAEGFKVVPEIS